MYGWAARRGIGVVVSGVRNAKDVSGLDMEEDVGTWLSSAWFRVALFGICRSRF